MGGRKSGRLVSAERLCDEAPRVHRGRDSELPDRRSGTSGLLPTRRPALSGGDYTRTVTGDSVTLLVDDTSIEISAEDLRLCAYRSRHADRRTIATA